jgi:hypothetical protein
MYKALNGAIIAIGLAGATLAMAGPANAQVGVQVGPISVGFGDIAYGYQDGYWDSGRHWHTWRNDQEMNDYRNYKGNHYNDYKHDRDSDNGWHS